MNPSYSFICEHPNCKNPVFFYLEWWGLNQFGEFPEAVDELRSCSDSNHLLALAQHEYYVYPDEVGIIKRIVGISEDYEPRSGLLDIVKATLIKAIDPLFYARKVEAYSQPEQLTFFPIFSRDNN